MNGYKILKKFLNEMNISETYLDLIKSDVEELYNYFLDINDTNDSSSSIVKDILVESYCLNAEEVKRFSNSFVKSYGNIGREHKNLVKHYYDYRDQKSVNELFHLLCDEGVLITYDGLKLLLNEYYVNHQNDAVEKFITNWNLAIKDNDTKKLYDYLMGIFTSLLHIVDLSKITLKEIYNYNLNFFYDNITENSLKTLKERCFSDCSNESIDIQAKKFGRIYNELLSNEKSNRLLLGVEGKELKQKFFDDTAVDNNSVFAFSKTACEFFKSESSSLVILKLTQDIYDKFQSTTAFYDYVLATINSAYRILDNYRVLSVIIENIFDEKGQNLKWNLYSIIGIYAEHFIPKKCTNNFYHPEKLCYEYLNYAGLTNNESIIKIIADYYLEKISIEELSVNINISVEDLNIIGKIDELKNVWYGFTFQDCLSLRGKRKKQNPEIEFIENDNDILFIFSKFRPDEHRIPCPDCGGLNISGNSYPEVGHRSWECKNVICPSRSKSNRGKRYSYRSNFMQEGSLNRSRFNLIPNEFIKKWHRDIVTVDSNESAIEMLIRYFSFEHEKILFINGNADFCQLSNSLNRSMQIVSSDENGHALNMADIDYSGLYEQYFDDGEYVSRYTLEKTSNVSIDSEINQAISSETALLISGNCYNILSKIKDNTIDGAVTSPPYYNARAYSQWANYYLYWSDMYNIIKQCYRVMKPGTVFLYNVGDICGNENTVACSTMGNKRLLLGAYTIDLFKRAGFELLDDILWDKGEPQSNRQKNDGKFTPFYQKPLNCYEHMFIFKKPGAKLIVNEDNIQNTWRNNIVKFSPVIKINSKGENTIGHTAPFPKDIPYFLSQTFTSSKDSVVLDPFSGSLTSVIASVESGVRGLGIEMCEEYVQLSKERAQQEGIKLTII